MKKHKKWSEVYPQGTQAGDEEARFFRALARDPKYAYKSVAQLIKETGLSRERVEEIVDKYHTKMDPPLIYPHANNSETWSYWERIKESLKADDRNIAQKDQDNRVDGHIKGTTCSCGPQSCHCSTEDDQALPAKLCQKSEGIHPPFSQTYHRRAEVNVEAFITSGEKPLQSLIVFPLRENPLG
jgi:hypothetical protein